MENTMLVIHLIVWENYFILAKTGKLEIILMNKVSFNLSLHKMQNTMYL